MYHKSVNVYSANYFIVVLGCHVDESQGIIYGLKSYRALCQGMLNDVTLGSNLITKV